MNQGSVPVKRALISVSNKKGIVEFAQELQKLNIEIISTGGTSQLLRDANILVRDVSDITRFPEMMDGRLKTLHPKVHGGILGLRDVHQATAEQHEIQWIDLVVVNLYPFAATIQKPNVTMDDAIENIDIGGPTMIRAAAKNMGWVGVVVDPSDYPMILSELKQHSALRFSVRKDLATKAFAHTAQYDRVISDYLNAQQSAENDTQFPKRWNLQLEKFADLRYGENPHQAACAYRLAEASSGILLAKQHQGKQLSYNNISDADAAYACVREFSQPACVIVKHANPCGVAVADTLANAFSRAFAADSLSAFGGIVALNQRCTKDVAELIANIFVEVVVAPEYESEALMILARKTNLRVLEWGVQSDTGAGQEFKFVEGGMLVQQKDNHLLSRDDLTVVTTLQPTPVQFDSMLFAWQVLKYIKSNAILIANHHQTLGIGAGQVSRVDAVEIAVKKAGDKLSGAILASDAFFPFRDSIDYLASTGIKAVIQPGGSMRDEEVIAACNEYGIAMVTTGVRCFKH